MDIYEKEKAAKQYMESKISLRGAAENAKLTIPERIEHFVSKGIRLSTRCTISMML